MESGLEEPLNVMFFVNMVFTARTFKTLLRERMDDKQWAYCETHVGLVEALTHRGGYNPTEEMLAEDPLCISTGEGEVLPVDVYKRQIVKHFLLCYTIAKKGANLCKRNMILVL